jgi:hypothetical protein
VNDEKTLSPTIEQVYLTDMTYTGGCHCSKVRYEVDIENLAEVIACNCSICSKRGWLLTFVPPTAFRLIEGADMLTDYQFNKKMIHHLFCKVCGTASFGRGADGSGNEMIAINARCLDGLDVGALKVMQYDGKSI